MANGDKLLLSRYKYDGFVGGGFQKADWKSSICDARFL